LQFSLNFLGVQLEHTNVSSGRQVGLEVCLVEFKKLHHKADGVDGVLKLLISQAVDVKLLVAPVNFQNGLETFQENVCLVVSDVDQRVDLFLLGFENIGVIDPADRVQSQDFGLVPGVANYVVPLFEDIGEFLEVTVFAPTGEALDLL